MEGGGALQPKAGNPTSDRAKRGGEAKREGARDGHNGRGRAPQERRRLQQQRPANDRLRTARSRLDGGGGEAEGRGKDNEPRCPGSGRPSPPASARRPRRRSGAHQRGCPRLAVTVAQIQDTDQDTFVKRQSLFPKKTPSLNPYIITLRSTLAGGSIPLEPGTSPCTFVMPPDRYSSVPRAVRSPRRPPLPPRPRGLHHGAGAVEGPPRL